VTLEQVFLSIAIAAVPAAASIIAAVLASRAATRARTAEGEAARLRAAEERLAARKFELYQPMLSGFGNMMLPGNATKALSEVEAAMPSFLNFATVWASDEALQAFFRFRIASGAKPPTAITMRLIADFFVAARVDLSGMKTTATGLEVIGMRVNDLYEYPEYVEAFTMPFEKLAAKHEWAIPWE
jgi:hypothetical protein